MGNLIIQDGFEPYFAGCRAEPVKPDAKPAEPKAAKAPRIAPAAKPLSIGKRVAVLRPKR